MITHQRQLFWPVHQPWYFPRTHNVVFPTDRPAFGQHRPLFSEAETSKMLPFDLRLSQLSIRWLLALVASNIWNGTAGWIRIHDKYGMYSLLVRMNNLLPGTGSKHIQLGLIRSLFGGSHFSIMEQSIALLPVQKNFIHTKLFAFQCQFHNIP